ncbi:YfhE family protein [Siminovitchia sp. FSL H7-0308]|uniref:Chloramphenicol 3-O-phosphotransferase n=1 Tax=Siminovitchia thermophila TaxID=1245522 RepID=A0ABS2RBM7_9BACI|nr:YfhE family protein [Siminovitchia thermophila]MBM7717052.1 chloramphenicol 3-O-phosphotransferase [Siminovitchia thermophila]ONK25172.1 YfhE family protein [Bacillus sp. VT-16-64]
MKKGKEFKSKNKLSATQEVLYQREFKRADRAGGYVEKERK